MKWYYKYGFSTGQYKGLVLVLALNAMFIVYYLYTNFSAQDITQQDFSAFENKISEIEKQNKPTAKPDSLFSFDPNSVSVAQMEQLGLNQKIAERINNYRNKGGKFKQPKDLLNIYGIDSSWFYKVEDFVNIAQREEKIESDNTIKPFNFNPNTVSKNDLLKMNLPKPVVNSWVNYLEKGGQFKSCNDLAKLYNLEDQLFEKLHPHCFIEKEEKIEKEWARVDLNLADSVELLELRGVGPVFAGRIVSYRNKLGGFVSQNQLLEIYGMDTIRVAQFSTQAFLTAVDVELKYVNTDDFKVLLRHPYLNYEQVKSIVNFRDAVGAINKLSDLVHLEGFTEADLHRLQPYLSFKIKD